MNKYSCRAGQSAETESVGPFQASLPNFTFAFEANQTFYTPWLSGAGSPSAVDEKERK